MTVPGRPSSPGACGAAGLPTGAEPSVTRWGCAGAQAPACAAVGVPQHPRADRQAARARRLTDSQGRTVSFANALVVMTSNVGSAVIAKGGGGLGFQLTGACARWSPRSSSSSSGARPPSRASGPDGRGQLGMWAVASERPACALVLVRRSAVGAGAGRVRQLRM